MHGLCGDSQIRRGLTNPVECLRCGGVQELRDTQLTVEEDSQDGDQGYPAHWSSTHRVQGFGSRPCHHCRQQNEHLSLFKMADFFIQRCGGPKNSSHLVIVIHVGVFFA